MSYLNLYSLCPDDKVVAAWESQVVQANETPWLADALAKRGSDLFPRFAACYAELRALPRSARRALQRRLRRSRELTAILPERLGRSARRSLQHKLARSLAGAALLLALGQGVSQAATITVNTNVPRIIPNGLCSLVEAIINANNDAATHADCAPGSGADTIVLPALSSHMVTGIYDNTYGPTRLPAITSAMTIEGNGGKITRKGGAQSRLIAVTTTGDLTLENVTVSGGQHAYGGAIFSYGNLTIADSTITGNKAVAGGGIAIGARAIVTVEDSAISRNTALYGGGVFSYDATVTIANSTVTGNRATFGGGGLYGRFGTFTVDNSTLSRNSAAQGGAIYTRDSTVSTVTIANSAISQNTSSQHGGGIMFRSDGSLTIQNSTISGNVTRFNAGGVLTEFADVTIENSTISGNRASTGAGGISTNSATIENSTISTNTGGYGGGIWGFNLTLINSTISGNRAKYGSGILGGNMTVANCTVSGNRGTHGGGIFNAGGQLILSRTLISGNTATIGREMYNRTSNGATVVADEYNLFGFNGSSGVVGFVPGASDIVPGAGVLLANILAPLANNGGPTLTRALVPGSPAIDAIPAGDPGCTGTDQRGTSRPFGAGCDIGAFEGPP